MKPLSAEQQKVVAALQPDLVLVRVKGGFWTYRGCPLKATGAPRWYTGIQTVRAMERLGLLKRLNVYPEEWRDERRLAEQSLPTQGVK